LLFFGTLAGTKNSKKRKTMTKTALYRYALLGVLATGLMTSCQDKDENITEEPVADQTFSEEFDNLAAAEGRGWIFANKSDEVPTGIEKGWITTGAVPPQSGSGFLLSTYEASEGDVINAWAVSPEITVQNGDKVSFYTFSINDYVDPLDIYPDRLQLRLTTKPGDDMLSDDPTSVGAFTINLVDVNPLLIGSEAGYPSRWTKFEATISGLNKPVKGRVAFRYFVSDLAANGYGIGIDKLEYTSVNH
jgi:hypothetical protein